MAIPNNRYTCAIIVTMAIDMISRQLDVVNGQDHVGITELVRANKLER